MRTLEVGRVDRAKVLGHRGADGARVDQGRDAVEQLVLLAYKSRIDVLADIRAGRLVAALTDYEPEATPLYLVCAHRQSLSPAVVKLREFLAEKIRAYLQD